MRHVPPVAVVSPVGYGVSGHGLGELDVGGGPGVWKVDGVVHAAPVAGVVLHTQDLGIADQASRDGREN